MKTLTIIMALAFLTCSVKSWSVISKNDHPAGFLYKKAPAAEAEDESKACKEEGETKKGEEYKEASLSSHYCTCAGDICKCCLHVTQEKLGLNDTLCVDVEYLRTDLGIKFEMTWDGNSVISEEVSARNPPPICAEIPIPKLEKLLSGCVRLHNISISSTVFEACVGVELEVAMVEVLEVQLGCLSLGGHKDQQWMCAYHHPPPHSQQQRLPSCVNMCHKQTGLYDSQLFKTENRKTKVSRTFVKNGCHYMKNPSQKDSALEKESGRGPEMCIVGCVPDGYMD